MRASKALTAARPAFLVSIPRGDTAWNGSHFIKARMARESLIDRLGTTLADVLLRLFKHMHALTE
jgi:hypothetical protein